MQKKTYLAPETTVLEVSACGIVCASILTVTAILAGEPESEINWSRGTYGEAESATWQ